MQRWKRNRDPAEDQDQSPEEVKSPLQQQTTRDGNVNHPFAVPFTYEVQQTFTLNNKGTSTNGNNGTSIGDQFMVLYHPTIGATYLTVSVLLKAGSVLQDPNGTTNQLLSAGAGSFTFSDDAFIPLGGEPLVGSALTDVLFGQGNNFTQLPTFETAEVKECKLVIQSSSASTTSMALVGYLYSGMPPPNQYYYYQNNMQKMPAFLKTSSTSKINCISVPLQDGIKLTTGRVGGGQVMAGAFSYFNFFGGDGRRLSFPMWVDSIKSSDSQSGSFNLFFSSFGTYTEATGDATCSSFQLPIFSCPPGFVPELEVQCAVSETALTALNSTGVQGIVQITHYWLYVSSSGLQPALVTQTARPVTCPPVILPPWSPGSSNGTIIAQFTDCPWVPAPSGNGCTSNQCIWLGCGLRVIDNRDLDPNSVPFAISRIGLKVRGLFCGNRGVSPYTVVGTCTSDQQQIVVTGYVDVEAVPGSTAAPFITGNIRADDKIVFSSPVGSN